MLLIAMGLFYPARATLAIRQQPTSLTFLFYLDYVLVDVFFGYDILLRLSKFVEEYTESKHTAVYNVQELRAKYLKGFFLSDAISLLPIDLVFVVLNQPIAWSLCRLTRLLRFVRFNNDIQYLKHLLVLGQYKTLSTLLSSSRLLASTFMIVYWLACVMLSVASSSTLDDGWTRADPYYLGQELDDDGVTTPFIRSIYWAFMTVTTVGYGDIRPEGALQTLVVCLILIFGVPLYTAVVAFISSMATHINPEKVRLQVYEEICMSYMQRIELPKECEDKVNGYFVFLWTKIHQNEHLDNQEALERLPKLLQARVMMNLYGSLLKDMPVWKGCSSDFLRSLVTKFSHLVMPTQEFVFRKQEKARAIYFIINDSTVNVLNDDEIQVLKTIRRHQGTFLNMSECISENNHSRLFSEYIDEYR